MEVILGTVCIVLLGVIILDNTNQYYREAQWRKERAGLLDRIMARSYEEYAEVGIKQQEAVSKAEKKLNVISVKELRDQMEREASEGIAI
jgi:tetrahydrodipicolinate N-succinyltransferase